MRITRRHHPLAGREFEVLDASAKNLVVRLPDGSRLRLPRDWTDASGEADLRGDDELTTSTIDGLRQLLRLVGSLKERRS